MRKYIRHPTDVPIDVRLENVVASDKEYLHNISLGGLCFKSKKELAAGTSIVVRIPLVKPIFEAKGEVVWCRESMDGFDIGVEFQRRTDLFRARMIEQVCYIEHYKNEILKKEGRSLTGEEAALEWINKFASEFPYLDVEETSE